MSTELIVIIVIVGVLAPLLFMNTRKNKKQSNNRKDRAFMKDYLEKKDPEND